MEKSWNLKMPLWKNHGNFFFELHAHYPKKICAVHAYSYDANEIGVCFIFYGEGVTKRGDVEATVRKVK